ncbi:MAG: double-strand break repair protein AddB, partial [Pikeienuella sp.]
MIRLFDNPGPRVFGAPPGADFTVGLAAGARARLSGAPPEALAGVEIALNTRRAVRMATEAFEAAGPAAFLPRFSTIEDFAFGRSDAPPAVPRLSRHLTLTRLVGRFLAARPELGPESAAGALAEALAALLDERQREGAPLDRLD